MRTISKKILSLMLVAVLVMSAIPFAAFATEEHNCAENSEVLYDTFWYCNKCGKIYSNQECTEEVSDEEYDAWVQAHIPDNGNTGIAPQSATDEVAIEFVLALEGVDEANWPKVTKNRKVTETMGAAPGIGSFTSKVANVYDLDDYKTNVQIWTTSETGEGGTAYNADVSVANVGAEKITYYSVTSLKRMNVTVQATWTDGSAKTVTLFNDELVLKNYKDSDIIDFLANYQNTVNTAVSDGHFATGDSFKNFGWDGFWYEGSTKITNQKFTSKGLNTTYTFTAKLTKNAKSKVTFDPNGGSCSVESKELNTGASYGTLPVPTRSGMVFVGWFSDMPATDDLQYDANGYVKVSAPVKQYFNNTAITENVTLYAWWAQQADITLYVYNNNAPGANPVDTGKVLGVPVGAKLLRSHITSALTGTTDLFGPFEKNGGKDDSTSTWAHYAYYRNGVNVLGKKVDKTEELAVFVNPGRLKDNQNVGINYNVAPGGSSGSGSNSSSGSGSGSSAATDPSNPKTGDAQRAELNAASITLAVATVALGAMTSVMFVRRKREA